MVPVESLATPTLQRDSLGAWLADKSTMVS